VLAHVAQEAERGKLAGPFQVVDDAGWILALQREQVLDLGPDAFDPGLHDPDLVEDALG
jgi:hypothetical protein